MFDAMRLGIYYTCGKVKRRGVSASDVNASVMQLDCRLSSCGGLTVKVDAL